MSTPEERAAHRKANREKHAAKRAEELEALKVTAAAAKAEKDRVEKQAELDAEALARPPAHAREDCPDPFSPDALRALFAKGYRRLWQLLDDPRSTNQDVVQGFTAARLAAGIGKEAPAADAFKLPMDSILPSEGPKA